ncbi:hypothetical protein Acr_14g0004740 [Actinidia rufa]|uniref:Uncharacterized protein n=1 Tax=Actinidia rufa TaxID=165716 RepID=A0A7J0FQ46_9ERIC|nr:hypothetical protein Acr_14g0004740 [Actinidia rufa]
MSSNGDSTVEGDIGGEAVAFACDVSLRVAIQEEALDDGSKGKQVAPLPEAKKAKTNRVAGVISAQPLVPGEGARALRPRGLSRGKAKEKKVAEENKARNKEMVRLEAKVTELKKSQALTKMDQDFLTKEEAEAEERERKKAEKKGKEMRIEFSPSST